MSETLPIAQIDHASIRKATGPRSEVGKQRSSRNATRHGIFSEVTVLPNESARLYESHLKKLRDTLRPEGGLEELLVDKLASIAWRLRRLLVTEGAEIRRGNEFIERDQRDQQGKDAEYFGTRTIDSETLFQPELGLISEIRNPVILERCVELLVELRSQIEEDGFDRENDVWMLKRIYGSETHLRETLYEGYIAWADTAGLTEEERDRQECATPEQSKKNFLSETRSYLINTFKSFRACELCKQE